MTDVEAIEMMKRCSNEIKSLRTRLAVLAPKAEAYDNMAALIGLLPRPSQGYEPDLTWTLDKRIEELLAPKADKQEPHE